MSQELDEFAVIQTVVTLARSGEYLKKEPLLKKMRELFPEVSEGDLLRLVARAFRPAARDA